MKAIDSQIQASIQDQLDALEELFHQYSPRKIGKHHPEYVPAAHTSVKEKLA